MQFTNLSDDTEDAGHTRAERAAAAARSTWVSVAVNLALTSTQIVAGILSRSQGLVADGIHSLSDLVADFVVLLANHHCQKDADADHPYGHHRYETALRYRDERRMSRKLPKLRRATRARTCARARAVQNPGFVPSRDGLWRRAWRMRPFEHEDAHVGKHCMPGGQ